VFLDALTCIEDVRKAGGTVFVHCHQGVSRAASVVLSYVMWALQLVRAWRKRPAALEKMGAVWP